MAGHVLAVERLHADDTPVLVPVLAPGTGRTKTSRLWGARAEASWACCPPEACSQAYPLDRTRMSFIRRGGSHIAPHWSARFARAAPKCPDPAGIWMRPRSTA